MENIKKFIIEFLGMPEGSVAFGEAMEEWDKINNIKFDERFKMIEKHPQLDLKEKLGEQLYYSQFTMEGVLEYIKNKTISLDVLKLILSKVPEYEIKMEGAIIGSDKFILQELKEIGYLINFWSNDTHNKDLTENQK